MKQRAQLDKCQLSPAYKALKLHTAYLLLWVSLWSFSIPWVHIRVHHWHQTLKKVTSWVWEKKVDQQGCGTDPSHSLQRKQGLMLRGLWLSLMLNFLLLIWCSPFHFQDLNCNSPYCPPYHYYDVMLENLASNQLITPPLLSLLILITCQLDNVLILWGEILSWSLLGV